MTRAWVIATHTDRAALFSALVILASFMTAPSTIDAGLPVPLHTVWFVHLALVTCAMLPLIPTYTVLGATFPRATQDRALRALSSAVILGASVCVVHWRTSTPGYVLLWCLLLTAVGFIVAALRADLAWMVVLVVGIATIAWEHTDLSSPMSRVLPDASAPLAIGALVVGAGAHVLSPARR